MVEATAKIRPFSVTSVTPISTPKRYRLDGGPSQGWASAVYELGKKPTRVVNCWWLALRVNKDGTTKMRKQRNEKKWKNGSSAKKVEKAKKSWNGPASKRRRRCSGGNLWEAREVPTEPAQKKRYYVSMFTYKLVLWFCLFLFSVDGADIATSEDVHIGIWYPRISRRFDVMWSIERFPCHSYILVHRTDRSPITASWWRSARQDRYIPDLYDLYDLAHVAGWEPYSLLYGLAQVSWMASVLHRSCAASHNGRLGASRGWMMS